MKISKLNEVYLILEVNDSLEKELYDYFTFEVPGAKFMPHYRKKLWDGKIRLFSPHNGRIYVGLLPYIKEFCSKNSIEYIMEDGVENERNVIREDVRGFATSLHPTSKGKEIEFRNYQLDAIHHAISLSLIHISEPTRPY